MTIKECTDILKTIDLTYNVSYSIDEEYIKDWYKDLKNYDFNDVCNSLENHLKSNYSNIPPKKWSLLNSLKTIENKEKLKYIKTTCRFCKKNISMEEFEKHYSRCQDIDFIEKNVKEYLNQQIIREDYYIMSDEDLKRRFDKIAKIVMEKNNGTKLSNCLKKYFEGDKV
jgi:hypothetical protein